MINLTILLIINNRRHEEANIMFVSPHAFVENEQKLAIVAKPRRITKKLNPNQNMGCETVVMIDT